MITVRFAKKAELTDFSQTAGGIIVRQSVVTHLTDARISGWRAGQLQVEAVSRLRDYDLNYSELVIIGHTSGYSRLVALELDRECEECGRRSFVAPQEGLPMPLECWDGSDIFVIDELPGLTLVTEAVRQVIEQYRHTGVKCTPIADWRDPFGWMQEKRKAQAPASVWPPIR